MKNKLLCRTALLMGLGSFGVAASIHAAEFGANTPYYEDDGWLDITEWFDGNDYNPTDEAWWRWDDETYQRGEDVSGDQDSDWFGYNEPADDDDWFYDYYDPYTTDYYDYDANNLNDYGVRYFDYDNDGIYDASMSYSDWDNDGIYDDYDYYTFTDVSKPQQQQQAKSQAAKESRQQQVSGQIQKTKQVKVRGGMKHLVVGIQPQQGQQGQLVMADLGKIEEGKSLNPKVGDKITVTGPKAQFSKQTVILAKSAELNGQTTQIDRNLRSISGNVVDTRKVKVRGNEHLLAMVDTKQKDKQHKIAVDLGRADQLKMNVKKGDKLTFTGFPVKVKDKPMMIGQSVISGDKWLRINRQPSKPAGSAQPAAGKQPGANQQPGAQPQGNK